MKVSCLYACVRILLFCMCVYFLLLFAVCFFAGAWAPCQFLVSGASRPWEGAYPPRHKSARQVFRRKSRSARHSPHQLSRATCVPGTECGLNPNGLQTGIRAIDAECRSAMRWGMCLPLRAFSFCMVRALPNGAGGQHPHMGLPVCIPGQYKVTVRDGSYRSKIRFLCLGVCERWCGRSTLGWVGAVYLVGSHRNVAVCIETM